MNNPVTQSLLLSNNNNNDHLSWLDIKIIVILLITALIILEYMLRNGVIFQSHDIQTHIMWLQYFSRTITEGIWYPRWLAYTNYGYGSPDFVFYPPLIYYFASFLKLSGLDIQTTICFLFLMASFGAGISFYIYSRQRWGKIAACLGSVAYMMSPYMIYNIYIRGALPETWSLAWLPLGLFLTDLAIKKPKWKLVLAIFFSLLSLTHVPSLLMYTVIWFLYTLGFLFRGESVKSVITTISAAFLGFGLVSLYLLPAILEKSLVNIDSMRSVSGGFKANLVGTPVNWINKLINSHIQPIFSQEMLTIILLAVIIFICYRHTPQQLREVSLWLIFALSLAFLITYPSVRIWQASRTLQMIQFPWRLLGILAFAKSVLISMAVSIIPQKKKSLKLFFYLVIIIIFLLNAQHSYQLSHSLPGYNNPGILFSPEIKKSKYQPYNRFQSLKTILEEPFANKKLHGKPEYLPLTSTGNPVPQPQPQIPPVSLVSGNAYIKIQKWNSYHRICSISVIDTSVIEMKSYYYPAWHIYVNQQPQPILVSEKGTIQIKLQPGAYQVELLYLWTDAFKVGVILSLISIITLVLLLYKFPEFLI